MKKITTLLTAALVTGTIWSSSGVLASHAGYINQPETVSGQTNEIVNSTNYMKFSGFISEIKQSEKTVIITVEDPNTSTHMIFPISDEVLLLNSKTTEKHQTDKLKKGASVEAYYDKNKPMPLIYPAKITPDILVVHDKEMGQVKISKFDDNFLSLDQELKLHVSGNTVLTNLKGEIVKQDDMHGQEWIVFYDVTTRSIPAQTTPKKIIVLNHIAELPTEVQEMINQDHYSKDGVKMIPLRIVAEHLGYQVEWQQETWSVVVSKQDRTFHMAIGEKGTFAVSPDLKDGKCYVPDEFMYRLLEK